MALSKIQSKSVNLAGNFAFTGNVTGAGKLLQVVHQSYPTQTEVTGTTTSNASSIGLSATITPISTNNKLLIKGDISVQLGYTTDPGAGILVHDGSSIVFSDLNQSLYINGDGNEYYRLRQSFQAYITPASINAITYNVRMWKSQTTIAQPNGVPSMLTIMEISV